MLRAWGNVRVSTDDQLKSTLGVRGYIERICQYADQNKLDLGNDCHAHDLEGRPIRDKQGRLVPSRERIVVESESAYKTPFMNRPGVKRILSLREGNDILIVAKVDRAFRSMEDAAYSVKKLRESRVPLHFVDMAGMNLDLTDSADPVKKALASFFLAVMAFAAEMESAQKSERQRSSHRQRKLTKGWSNHTPPIGFRFSGKGTNRKMVPCPQQVALMRQVRDWKKQGYGRDRITAMLKNEKVVVDYRAEWVQRRYGTVPGIKAVEKFLRQCNRVDEIERLTGLKPEDGDAWLDYYHQKYLAKVEEIRVARQNRRSERLAREARKMLAKA